MLMRERDYDVKEVKLYTEDSKCLWIATVFISQEYTEINWENIKLIHDNIFPETRYLNICINALKWSKYYEDFLTSTYLSDGKTLLKQYIYNNIDL